MHEFRRQRVREVCGRHGLLPVEEEEIVSNLLVLRERHLAYCENAKAGASFQRTPAD